MDVLNKIVQFCDTLPQNWIFKKCCANSLSYLVIMKKLVSSETNEKRRVTCNQIAKFRASVVETMFIINIKTGEFLDYIHHVNPDNLLFTAIYRVGRKTEAPHFNKDVQIVCGPGIHYFLTYDSALSYDFTTGVVKKEKEWFDHDGAGYSYDINQQ